MVERSVQIVNRDGLHARPAGEVVKVAAASKSHVTIVRDDLEGRRQRAHPLREERFDQLGDG